MSDTELKSRHRKMWASGDWTPEGMIGALFRTMGRAFCDE